MNALTNANQADVHPADPNPDASSPTRHEQVTAQAAGAAGDELTWPEKRLAFGRGWRGRCPFCGEGRIFQSYGRPHHDCSECGHVYRREQGAMTGSMYLSAAVTQIVAAILILTIFFGTDWSVGTSLMVSVPIVFSFCVFWLPRSIGLWIAFEYLTDVGNRETWAARPRPDGAEATGRGAEERGSGPERQGAQGGSPR